jgi:hypothetical protein
MLLDLKFISEVNSLAVFLTLSFIKHILASDMIAFVIVNVNGEEELKQSFLDMASNNAQV